jgi:hypothetical protein
MATWIVHLRIAENLLGMIPDLESPQFAVGNIAPDSGIPDEKWENFTPSSEITHFKAPDNCTFKSDDLEFYRRYLLSRPWPGIDIQERSFLWGYFCHLVTDNLWDLRIGKPTYDRFKAQLDANHDFIWEVKKDWYGLDFVYVREHPNSLFWMTFQQCEYTTNYLDILLPEGVKQRIEYIKTFYRRTDAETQELFSRERIYLTELEVNHFVDEATQKLYHGYNQLQKENFRTDGFHSILELIL